MINNMRIKLCNSKEIIIKTTITIISMIMAITMILPFLWMISTSVKRPSDVFTFPIEWIPKTFDFSHHMNVWMGESSMLINYINSIKVTGISILFTLLTCSLAAYGFSKIRFKGREVLFLVYISLMMIPPQILYVPKFLMFQQMGIYDTHLSLILPHLTSITGVFFMRQFYLSIPNSLIEAARIDGAGHFQIWYRIILPLSKAIIASFAIICFTWYWNDYSNPLIFLSSEELYTIPVALNKFVLEDNVDYNGMMAAASAGIIPVIFVFLIGQKYIVEGIASSGIKG